MSKCSDGIAGKRPGGIEKRAAVRKATKVAADSPSQLHSQENDCNEHRRHIMGKIDCRLGSSVGGREGCRVVQGVLARVGVCIPRFK